MKDVRKIIYTTGLILASLLSIASFVMLLMNERYDPQNAYLFASFILGLITAAAFSFLKNNPNDNPALVFGFMIAVACVGAMVGVAKGVAKGFLHSLS
jgi:hypothetical protein